MSTQAQGSFKIESWDEQPYVETEGGGKLTRASVRQSFDGDIEGDGQADWLMCYRPDQTADFVGFARVVGRVGDRSGSLVLESSGSFDGQEAKGPLTIVAGSGTGDLEGIAGEGELVAPLGGEPSVSLNYRFD
jgi:Protein of unknown function (DUF3224)